MEENKNRKRGKIKGFFCGWFNKLDKKIEEKAKSSPCCCSSQDKKKDSCCG